MKIILAKITMSQLVAIAEAVTCHVQSHTLERADGECAACPKVSECLQTDEQLIMFAGQLACNITKQRLKDSQILTLEADLITESTLSPTTDLNNTRN